MCRVAAVAGVDLVQSEREACDSWAPTVSASLLAEQEHGRAALARGG